MFQVYEYCSLCKYEVSFFHYISTLSPFCSQSTCHVKLNPSGIFSFSPCCSFEYGNFFGNARTVVKETHLVLKQNAADDTYTQNMEAHGSLCALLVGEIISGELMDRCNDTKTKESWSIQEFYSKELLYTSGKRDKQSTGWERFSEQKHHSNFQRKDYNRKMSGATFTFMRPKKKQKTWGKG